MAAQTPQQRKATAKKAAATRKRNATRATARRTRTSARRTTTSAQTTASQAAKTAERGAGAAGPPSSGARRNGIDEVESLKCTRCQPSQSMHLSKCWILCAE